MKFEFSSPLFWTSILLICKLRTRMRRFFLLPRGLTDNAQSPYKASQGEQKFRDYGGSKAVSPKSTISAYFILLGASSMRDIEHYPWFRQIMVRTTCPVSQELSSRVITASICLSCGQRQATGVSVGNSHLDCPLPL